MSNPEWNNQSVPETSPSLSLLQRVIDKVRERWKVGSVSPLLGQHGQLETVVFDDRNTYERFFDTFGGSESIDFTDVTVPNSVRVSSELREHLPEEFRGTMRTVTDDDIRRGLEVLEKEWEENEKGWEDETWLPLERQQGSNLGEISTAEGKQG